MDPETNTCSPKMDQHWQEWSVNFVLEDAFDRKQYCTLSLD